MCASVKHVFKADAVMKTSKHNMLCKQPAQLYYILETFKARSFSYFNIKDFHLEMQSHVTKAVSKARLNLRTLKCLNQY